MSHRELKDTPTRLEVKDDEIVDMKRYINSYRDRLTDMRMLKRISEKY